jgi:arylformamidase
MQIYDVSVPLSSETITYPGDPGIEITEWKSLTAGDAANVSHLALGVHSGTHVDAPAHFIAGAAKVESLSLEILIGEARVVKVPDEVRVIDENFLTANVFGDCQRVLFKTRNSGFWSLPERSFKEDFTHLDSGAARRLVEAGIKLVGIDYLSVEGFKSQTFETHHILLSHGVVILEGLDLSEVPPGAYELICLPLRIAGGSGDGAPARTVLRTLD